MVQDGNKEKFLNLIATYVPPPVLREFVRNPTPVRKNYSNTVEGTVMFAGILRNIYNHTHTIIA